MKPTIFLFLLLALHVAQAQDFITRGKIEFEVKKNNKKIFNSSVNGDDPFAGALPAYDVSYRDLVFANNQLIYTPGRQAPTLSLGNANNSVYTDLDLQKTVARRYMMDDYYVYEDSLHKIKWKIENETRKIAGWECRKAVGRIHDSVYVVAFYCPEIIPQGGPELFSGLPGMILGLAIPRYYTTWFATKIELANIDESKITPPVIKKSKQYSRKELAEIIYKKYKAAGWWKEATVEKVFNSLGVYTL